MKAACCVIAIVLSSTAARADQDCNAACEAAGKLFDQGNDLYSQGKEKDAADKTDDARELYRQAAEKFEAAYARYQNDAYLFSLGVVYLKLDRCKEAVERLQLFLDKQPQAPNRARAESQLATAKKCAPKEREPRKPDDGALQSERPPPPPPPAKRSLVVPASLGVAGAALLGVGIAFTVKVNANERDRAAVCPTGCTWDDVKDARAKELTDQGERNSKIAIASYVVGSLAIAGGIAVYVTSKPKARETAVTLAPSSGGGLVIGRVRF